MDEKLVAAQIKAAQIVLFALLASYPFAATLREALLHALDTVSEDPEACNDLLAGELSRYRSIIEGRFPGLKDGERVD